MDPYVTLVVLGSRMAEALKQRLSAESVQCKCVPVISDNDGSVVEILVRSADLQRAVSVLESAARNSFDISEDKITGMGSELLIPVDFSESSFLACRVGFELARRLRLRPVILHAYASPLIMRNEAAGKSVNNNTRKEGGFQSNDAAEKAAKQMRSFCVRLHKEQREGDVCEVDFATILRHGIPEEAILEYIKSYNPSLVVMATRGKDKKEEELIGSVTAEVLDSCRVPVFTVPENYAFESIESIVRLALFCNIDRQDVAAVDGLMKLFDFPEVFVSLIPVDDRRSLRVKEKIADICSYLSEYYRNGTFETVILDQKLFREQLEMHIHQKDLQLLIVPNKKTNIFSRIFKPTMAHRFLFERDMPMLVLPV